MKTIYQQAIEKFGVPNQVDMLIEEMAELTQALLKWRRGKAGAGIPNVHEEFVDVHIMMEQIKLCLNKNQLEDMAAEKLNKLQQLIDKHV